ncbi:hypothetical protein P691DRAFT_769650, partial [Macrolepiota fuliginosa MF-IS2]
MSSTASDTSIVHAHVPWVDEDTTVEPLQEPFNVTVTPPNLGMDDAPNQDVAFSSALTAPNTEQHDTHRFTDMQPKNVSLSRLEELYKEGQVGSAIALLDQQWHITYAHGPHVSNVNNPNLLWTTKKNFLDLMVCVGRGLGLGAFLPNLETHHNYEFKLDLSKPFRAFMAKHVRLGFNPSSSMLWIGRSPA